MSISLGEYINAPENSCFSPEAVKQGVSAVPCYVPIEVVQADKESWGSILNYDMLEVFLAHLSKNITFYIDVDTLTPDVVCGGRRSGQYIRLESASQYRELIQRLKQEKLKHLVSPK